MPARRLNIRDNGERVETIRDMTSEEQAEYDAEFEVDQWSDEEIQEIAQND